MKTIYLTSAFLMSFLFTSCYTQFATDEYDDSYVVKKERHYRNYEDSAVENEPEEQYTEGQYIAEEEYYNDEYYYDDPVDEHVYVTEYHYSARPYIQYYRLRHYDPWDYYGYRYYPHRNRWGVSIRIGSYYDPYWVDFHCSPYDYWYYDPWDAWCGYPAVVYDPYYYYPNYYYNPYYYSGYGHGYYRNPRYLSSGPYRGKRGFDSANPSTRPVRTPRFADNDRQITTPDVKPVRSRTVNPTTDKRNPRKDLDRPVFDDEAVVYTPGRRPVVKDNKTVPEVRKPVDRQKPLRVQDNEVTRVKTSAKTKEDYNRRYNRKYYNSSDRIKSELNDSRNEVRSNPKPRYPRSEKRIDSDQRDKDLKRPAVQPRKSQSDENRVYKGNRKPSSSAQPPVRRPQPSRDSKPIKRDDKQSGKTYSAPKSRPVQKSPRSSELKPRYNSGSKSSGKSYSAPRSSGRSKSSSSVRSAPSQSRSGSAVRSAPSRSNSGSSKSGSSNRSGGKRSSKGN